jgi:predicted ATPase/DNA-binding winged helix-turn-helix (wHTH) protein
LEGEVTVVDAVWPSEYSFGSFRLVPGQRLLLEGSKPVPLGARAGEILIALVERAGSLVTKEELLARAWPNLVVEESNLKVHVAALRKALGDGRDGHRYIATTPGRGYCFVAEVTSSSRPTHPPRPVPSADQPHELSAPSSRMVGRSDIVLTLIERLRQHRFITIVGPGGIGKTKVAMAVADASAAKFAHGVRLVELAPLSDPALVPSALAAALGVAVRSENTISSLVGFLKDKQILVVLDNCEHVIDAAASLAEELFRGADGAHILATSREPLRVSGERVHRLAPLATPPASQQLTAAQTLAFPAVELFVKRAAASMNEFEFTDADAPDVAELCRRLDGIPLAIEIVAGSLHAFGARGLARFMDDRLRLLMPGRRTAQTRHKTLRMTLDWSYDLLPDFERATLRRLAIFAGVFTWDSAAAVLDRSEASDFEVFDTIANLIAKSLVSATIEDKVSYCRLLDTTRAYALTKLEESGETGLLARRHAEHYRHALAQAEIDWRQRPAVEWLEAHRHLLDNVRAALDWAFSPAGDAAIGVALTAAAVPLWFQMSLLSECCERVERALATPPPNPDPQSKMQLHAALAWSLMQTRGSIEKTRLAWNALLKHAADLGDIDYQLRALWGLWTGLINDARLKEGLAVADRFCELAVESRDSSDSFVGDRMVGYILHLMGEHARARPRIERMLDHYAAPITGSKIVRFIFDQRVAARCFLARILWLQGFPDQAVSAVEGATAEAKSRNDMFTLCQALLQAACPIAIFVGDLDRLGPHVAMLRDYSERNALGFWQVWARCFEGVHLIQGGKTKEGVTLLGEGLAGLRGMQYGVYYAVFLCEYAEALGKAGQVDRGLVAIDEALARSKRNDEFWYIPELLRVKGYLVSLSGGATASSDAEKLFRQSLTRARLQQAPSWELRTAISLFRLTRESVRGKATAGLLRSAYGKFTEGFGSVDLLAARRLLDELGSASGA